MKKGEKEIKAIIFDVGGVLQLPKNFVKLIQDSHLAAVPRHCGHRNKGVHEYLSKKFNVSLDQWFDSIDTAYAKSIEGKISEKKAVEIISKNLKVSPQKFRNFAIKAYKKNFTLNKQLFKQALKLKDLGYKIAILSDQWYLSKLALMSKSLTKYFSPVVVSCDVGIRKPNLKIYKLIIKELKLSPQQILFIDNQKWNIVPAKKLGMKTILFKDNKQLFENKTWRGLFENE